MKADRVAVELNRSIVARDQWSQTHLAEGDRLEIVHFVGGGTAAPARGTPSSHPSKKSTVDTHLRVGSRNIHDDCSGTFPAQYAATVHISRRSIVIGASPRQLQWWWDERRIVVPAREGHRRLYSMEDLAEVAVICELRRRGFSLQRVRKVMRFLQRESGKRPAYRQRLIRISLCSLTAKLFI